jgi:glycosyltransferase involved in cell wall biosynthesis
MISVCLPTYNGSKYILDQINSILLQLTDEDEIIISDDCSTDNTLKLIYGLKDSRIKVFENKKFPSYIFNFENAINRAKGDKIFFSDQDDIWLPNKVEIMSEVLNEADLIISDCYVTDSDLSIVHDSYYQIRKTTKSKILGLIGGSPYLGCCMAFNRTILSKALPFPKSVNSYDIWIGNIAAFYYKVKFIDDKLIYYRRHNGNISTMAGKSKSTYFDKLFDRLRTISNLMSRLR